MIWLKSKRNWSRISWKISKRIILTNNQEYSSYNLREMDLRILKNMKRLVVNSVIRLLTIFIDILYFTWIESYMDFSKFQRNFMIQNYQQKHVGLLLLICSALRLEISCDASAVLKREKYLKFFSILKNAVRKIPNIWRLSESKTG